VLSTLRVLIQIAFRNLFASRLKTLIVGGIVFAGALIVTVGGSLLDSVVSGMSRSIIGTLSGDIQVYSAQSKDELALFGNMGGTDPDLAQIEQYEKVRKTVESVPNVARVVPMGISGALVTSGNTIDVVLEKLRAAVRKEVAGDHSPAVLAQIQSQKDHVQQIVSVLQKEQQNGKTLIDQTKITQDDRDNAAALAKATDPGFWVGFDQDPLNALEFLENKIAPQSADADLLYLRYVGTDMDAFRKSFDRFRIVDGQAIPEGHRGFLFSKFFYEDRVKLRTARRLDVIHTALAEKGQKIASDTDLTRMVHENQRQTREILLQLDAASTAKMRSLLQDKLGSQETDVGKLLEAFLDTTDANFLDRYKFFYDQLTPMLELYRIRIGDLLTIKAFTKTGYSRSVNLKVYGTFEFEGLDKSPLAGAVNVMDLVSFRDLYGFLTADSKKEVEKLEQAAGGDANVDRSQAENELFGGNTVVASATPGLPDKEETKLGDVLPDLSLAGKLHREDLSARVYDPAEVERGIVLNAAVILKDHSRVKETMADIQAAAKRDGLDLKAVSWRDSAGLIGKLVVVFQVVLLVAVLVIFLVALVVINNALVMATLERVREIGTLRAVGAQRTFILGMLLVEAGTIGLVFGGLGSLLGCLVVAALDIKGIPATTDVLNFFFSGPRLHPFINPWYVLGAMAVVLLVSVASSFYPAWLAMRISPRQAMGAEE
jgi:ABC-type lipoprotein release transport system permease subunit